MSERVVTIDGPVGSGKGTIGQRLAIRLGWHFLDSGALYRACAYVAVQNGITAERTDALLDHLERVKFETIPVSQGGEARVLLNGEDISTAVRTAECGQMASKIAVNQNLRRAVAKCAEKILPTTWSCSRWTGYGQCCFSACDAESLLDRQFESSFTKKIQTIERKRNIFEI